MLERDAVKKAKRVAKIIKNYVYVLDGAHGGNRGYFTLTQQQLYHNPPAEDEDIVRVLDQYGNERS